MREKKKKKGIYFGQLKKCVCGTCWWIMDVERIIAKPLSPRLFEYFGNQGFYDNL
jgi:hypothetical protein